MKILMIAHFSDFSFEGGNGRFDYILNSINYSNNEVLFITSNFDHIKKQKRNVKPSILNSLKYKLVMLDEPGYKKNVSIKRIISHKIISYNLSRYMHKMDFIPDIIYCSIPSLDMARVAAKYAKNKKIRFVIDIQDLWPEAFKMLFNFPIISSIIFYPLKKKADYIYSNADEIIAVSKTYANRALKVNKKTKNGIDVFLGTNISIFDEYNKNNKVIFNDDIIRIAYIGTLGHCYDLKSIIDAISILNHKGIKKIKFIVMGDGPLKDSFEKYANEKNINYEFTGRLEYKKMVGLLCSCDIAVNPITHGAAQSIINKVGDYAASGLPVINTQECVEYRDLIEEYNAGLNCENENAEDIANKLEILINNPKLRKKLGVGNRKLAEDKFDRKKTYKSIINILEN